MPRPTSMRNRSLLIIGALAGLPRILINDIEDTDIFQIDRCETGAAALSRLSTKSSSHDAIMIADEMTDTDAASLCMKLRLRGLNTPIILLGSAPQHQMSEDEVVRGLDAGANDFIAQPFRFGEVMARLRAQMRLHENSDNIVLTVGAFQFRPAQRMLQHSQTGARMRLTEKEAAVLKLLYRADGPLSRNTLLAEIWGYSETATTHTVETHIYRLRRKIEPNPQEISLLVSDHGGYRLITPKPPRRDQRAPSHEMALAPT